MRILFTGASSFTGLWFVRELARRGHEVIAACPRASDDYDGSRSERVALLQGVCRREFGVRFGDERFLAIAGGEQRIDLLCHHAAEVRDYHSPDFDIAAALASNTRGIRAVLETLKAKGCSGVLLTGSVFEKGEGAGSDGLPSFSPYGVSKALTSEVFSFFCRAAGMRLAKFVIANPFGPHEEQRFTSYLARIWLKGERAGVRTPEYVRDNVHVSLLAKAYAAFAERAASGTGPDHIAVSGYAESQGAFAGRFAAALRPRLGVACELDLAVQTEWTEPGVRIATDIPDRASLGWNEEEAWDELADWYRSKFGGAARA